MVSGLPSAFIGSAYLISIASPTAKSTLAAADVERDTCESLTSRSSRLALTTTTRRGRG